MPRDPRHDIPSQTELRAKIREMGKKLGIKDEEENAPGAGTEHYPGGPSVDMGDFQLASRRRKRKSSTGMA